MHEIHEMHEILPDFLDISRASNSCKKTRTNVCEQEKKLDFPVPTDHRRKIREKIDKYLDLVKELEKTVGREGGGDTRPCKRTKKEYGI